MKWWKQNWRSRAWAAVPCALLLSAITCWWLAAPDPAYAPNPGASGTNGAPADTRAGQPEAFGAIPNRGESHSMAMSDLVARANANEQLLPSDIQTLLTFISAPKPGDLTDGEWEERVNGILNLLRRQTEDVETEDRRQEGTGSLASSGARVVTNAATGEDGVDWAAVDELLGRESGRIIGDGAAAQDVRISAIHACVDRKDAGPLPDLRKIAADGSLVSTLRKAAIHAIGQLGTAEDMALLERLPQDDGNLSMAVLPARKALESRKTGED